MFKSRTEYRRVVSAIANTVGANLKPVFGIYPWFIIKIQLSYQLHLAYAKGELPNFSKTKPHYSKEIKSYKTALKKTRALFKMGVKLWRMHTKWQLPNPDVLAVANKVHSRDVNGKDYNPYIHPHLNDLVPKTAYLYYLDEGTNELLEQKYLKQLLAFFTVYYSLRLFVSTNKKQRLLQYGKSINTQLLTEIQQPIHGLDQFIAERIIEYKVHYWAYKIWLKKMQPKTVLGYCYYDNRINALFGAANSLGIPTIECQHSAISNNHFAYAKWENAEQVKAHFPTCFYVWSPADVALIQANFTTNTYTPKVECKGIKHLNKKPFVRELQAAQNILICLQGIWMPEWLENFIRTDECYQWYIRLHPRYPNDKKQLENLDALQKENLHTKMANKESLASLLAKTKVLITCFSGTALEADAYGVKVLIYGDEGKTTYQDQINNGQFSYIENKIDLSNAINA